MAVNSHHIFDDMAVDLYLNRAFTRSSFFLFSLSQARDMKVTGDLQRASGYSKWALGFNMAALFIIILTIFTLVIWITVSVEMANRYRYLYENYGQ